MKAYLFIILFCASNLYGLDAESIRKLAAAPHDRTNLASGLEIYPDAREYAIKVRSGTTVAELMAAAPVVVHAKEKIVQGRYLVSEAMLPGADRPLIMVVEYQKDTETFKKWVLLPNGIVASSSGVADMGKRTIAWISDKAAPDVPIQVLTIETHSHEKSSWKETFIQDGKVISVSSGEATKTK